MPPANEPPSAKPPGPISSLHDQIINSAGEGIVAYGPDLRYQLGLL
jgi:hypothetical protein